METSVKLYSLKHSNVKTYLFALLFVAGNIALPQLCHLVPYGGPTLLPIYFFTLIAAYKYGFLVGLLTAILSPVINHLLFAMPSEAVLPILLIKSSLLAGASALAARTIKSVSLLTILGVVLTYQVIGVAFEWYRRKFLRSSTGLPYRYSGNVTAMVRRIRPPESNCQTLN